MRQPSSSERSRPASSPLASVAPLGLSRNAARGELATTPVDVHLSDHVVFNDEKLARRYAAEPIPISTLYEAYFDGSLDIPGDLVEFLQSRNSFVKHTITRQHLQWAVTNFVPEMVAHSREADARSARELYDDRGDDFFRAFLGERLSFTCAHFDSPTDSLENGVDQMNARICDKIGLRASHRVLEIGCGWGSFLAHVAATRGAECVGTTLSRAQEIQANRRFSELGIERQARSVLLDYRDLPAGTYDRIVCIEAVERVGVKNLKGFFEKLREQLVDDGLFYLQWTGLRRKLQPEDLMWGLFINKHIFPGADAALPLSSMLKVAEKSGWEVQGVENVSRHYAQTLRLWRSNWESNRARVVAEHGERWFRIWQFFLAWSQIVAEQGNAPVPVDYDGEGRSNIAVWRPSEGNWYIIDSQFGGGSGRQWGVPADLPVPGDYDRDGRSDLAVWRPSEGNWYVVDSSSGNARVQQWGTSGDKPVPGDYDADDRTDFAVWRPSEGNWYVIDSSSGNVRVQQWGVSGDVPVPGDYDADGRTDFAVWRPHEGNWYVIDSSSGNARVQQWGISGDKPVPGDYDRDGRTDFAVWRPHEGNWYVIDSSSGNGRVQQWGISGDKPVPGDYDRDGRTDFAVWRPSDGNWYVIDSSSGNGRVQQWGISGDLPVQGDYNRDGRTDFAVWRPTEGNWYIF